LSKTAGSGTPSAHGEPWMSHVLTVGQLKNHQNWNRYNVVFLAQEPSAYEERVCTKRRQFFRHA
jgi:hypothetical protein